MGDMFPCTQRPNTKEYNNNYDRIFKKEPLPEKAKELIKELVDELGEEYNPLKNMDD